MPQMIRPITQHLVNSRLESAQLYTLSHKMSIQAKDYLFAQEFITDAEGQIRKAVIDMADDQKLLEARKEMAAE